MLSSLASLVLVKMLLNVFAAASPASSVSNHSLIVSSPHVVSADSSSTSLHDETVDTSNSSIGTHT
jgi:hypothetical protein